MVLGFKVVWVTEVAMLDVAENSDTSPRASKGGRRTSGTLVQGHVRTPRGPGLTSRL